MCSGWVTLTIALTMASQSKHQLPSQRWAHGAPGSVIEYLYEIDSISLTEHYSPGLPTGLGFTTRSTRLFAGPDATSRVLLMVPTGTRVTFPMAIIGRHHGTGYYDQVGQLFRVAIGDSVLGWLDGNDVRPFWPHELLSIVAPLLRRTGSITFPEQTAIGKLVGVVLGLAISYAVRHMGRFSDRISRWRDAVPISYYFGKSYVFGNFAFVEVLPFILIAGAVATMLSIVTDFALDRIEPHLPWNKIVGPPPPFSLS